MAQGSKHRADERNLRQNCNLHKDQHHPLGRQKTVLTRNGECEVPTRATLQGVQTSNPMDRITHATRAATIPGTIPLQPLHAIHMYNICMYIYIYIHIHRYLYTYIYICIHIIVYAHACMYACMYAYVNIHTYIHTYMHTYIHAYIHTYIHIYMHICV